MPKIANLRFWPTLVFKSYLISYACSKFVFFWGGGAYLITITICVTSNIIGEIVVCHGADEW